MNVDVEGRHSYRLRSRVHGEGYILVTRAHGIGAEVDVVHAVGIHLNPLFTGINSDQFALGTGCAAEQRSSRNEDEKDVFHIACRLILVIGYTSTNSNLLQFRIPLEESRVGVTVRHRDGFELEAVAQEYLMRT